MHLRNKFIMAPIKLGYSNGDGLVNSKHLQFYEERSAYIGAVTIEPFYLDKGLREIPNQLGIDADDKLDGLNQLVLQIHQNGAQVIAHLNHPGRMANPNIPGNYFVSATDQACENGGAQPILMGLDQIQSVINLYVDSALRAEKSGFDIIELQMGHGYLLSQYLSPEVNVRSDVFGGSLENRMRFPLQVLQAVQAAVKLPIIVRVSAEEMTPGGIQIGETLTLCQKLEAEGVAAIHVSAGSVCTTPPWFFQHMFIPKGKTWQLASVVQSKIKIPVIFVGQINAPQDVDHLEKIFGAQYMAVGRSLIADPQFVAKITGKQAGNIRPCLACSEGCLGGVKSGQGLQCVVNPTVGKPPIQSKPVNKPKHFAIIGGGLAGMEAAINLYDRGFTADIYEKNRLGGQFNLASLPPGKSSLARIVEYYQQEISLRNIKIYHTEATAEYMLTQNYDEILIATGSQPMTPPIDGLTEYYWTEFLNDDQLPGQETILIVGGGLIGLEVASKLVDKHNKVIVVDLLPELAKDMEMIERALTFKKLNQHEVQFFLETRVERIDANRVYLSGKHTEILSGINKIVIATGMKSETRLYEELKDKIPCSLIGDAKRVGKAQDAIRNAYEFAQSI